MSLEPVIEEIISSAEAERKRMLSQAQSEADKILSQAKRDAERKLSAAMEEARKRAEAIIRRYVSSATFEGKRMELEMKKRFLEALKRSTMEAVLSKPQEDILRKLVKKYGAEGERYYTSERYAEVLKKVVGPKFGGTVRCSGGVVIEKKGGNVRIDCTYDTLIEDIWNTKLVEISSALFGGDE